MSIHIIHDAEITPAVRDAARTLHGFAIEHVDDCCDFRKSLIDFCDELTASDSGVNEAWDGSAL